MKILDIPQSGKEGLNVSLQGRYGQVRRALVIPTNPRTSAQMGVRDIFSRVAKGWRALTQAQREAWIAAAAQQQSKARLGQSGPLTGSQLYVKVNATLAQFGQPTVDTPPSIPAFPDLAPKDLVITNTGGVIALKLTCPTDPGEATIIRASAPQSAGREVCRDVRILGTCPAPVGGSADITGLYTARFGVPAAGTKVFVVANQFVDGYEDLGTEFTAVVPEGA
jgi:hypothetical protein